MFQKLFKILSIKIPTWLGALVYVFALLETILLTIHYFNPDLFFKILMRL